MTLNCLTSSKLEPFQHGFFTRQGGYSKGDYSGLNCGLRSQDSPENIRANRNLVAQSFGIEPQNLFTPYQVHSATVKILDHPLPDGQVRVDGLVTKSKTIALGVLTADCQPILFADREMEIVAAAHAGWQGSLAGIVENTLAAMIELGARRERIQAVIGPAISQENYEVGGEFRDEFLHKDPDSQPYFDKNSMGRWIFDLPAYGMMCLSRAGVQNAECMAQCTYGDPVRYFSYRRNHHHGRSTTGLMISVIMASQHPRITSASSKNL